MRIVLLGAPGSGKGTQSQLLVKAHRRPANIDRRSVARSRCQGHGLRLRAKAAMDSGKLVDDATVLGMIRERIGRRTPPRVSYWTAFRAISPRREALESLLEELGTPLDSVVLHESRPGHSVQAPDRPPNLSGLRTRCSMCYTSPPLEDKHRLIQRPDDKEEVIGKRLEVYEAQTKPLINYYEAAGLLRIVDADADVDTVFKSIERAVSRKRPKSSASVQPRASSRRVPISSRRQPVSACDSRSSGARVHGQRLEFAARREYFRADIEFRGAGSRRFCPGVRSALFAREWDAHPGWVPDRPGRRVRSRAPPSRLAARLSFSGGGARVTGSACAIEKIAGRKGSRRAADRGRAPIFRATRRWLWRGHAAPARAARARAAVAHAWAGSGSYSCRSLESQAVLEDPVLAPKFAQPLRQVIRDLAEVQDIVGRVFQLRPRSAAASTSRCASGPWGWSRRASVLTSSA